MATLSEALQVAIAQLQAGRGDLAEEIGRRILQAEPEHAGALHVLGCTARQAGRLAEAAEHLVRAVALTPDNPELHNNLGVVLKEQGRFAEAAACYENALRLVPDHGPAHSNLANILRRLGRFDAAADCLRRAIALDPRAPEPLNNLGNVLHAQGMLDEAEDCYRRALHLHPDFAEAWMNLGGVCKDRAELAEAGQCWLRALELRPGDAALHSDLLYLMHLRPEFDARAIADAQREWVRRHAAPLAGDIRPHPNERSPDRRLRIGYVSADLRAHVVGFSLLPLVRNHDHQQFEIFCYDDSQNPDEITAQFRSAADTWRRTMGLPDGQLAELVREDQVDILVDLALHTAGNRLLTFARQPAPVQISFIGYPGGTGLPMIPWWLADPYLVPPDGEEGGGEPIRLLDSYWCYQPRASAPVIGNMPSATVGHVTFGSLNNFCKLSRPVLEAWCQLLRVVPRSTLLLHAQPGRHRRRLLEAMESQGIAADRLTIVDRLPLEEYLRLYQQIDVALDPFPYGGGITTCDALWMGVPVVSLAGATAVGRGGVSILSNVGLDALIARDVENYVRIAAQLAGDVARRTELRTALRQRLQQSPLMDAPRFARSVENAYRVAWQRWCENGGG